MNRQNETIRMRHGQVRCAARFDSRRSRDCRYRLRGTRATVRSECANPIADTRGHAVLAIIFTRHISLKKEVTCIS